MENGTHEPRLCRIEQELGHFAACTEEQCPFWAAGVDGRDGACTFDELDLAGRRDVASWLHDLRAQLETLEVAARDEARRIFYARMNAGKSD